MKRSGFILLVLVFYFCTPDALGSDYKDCFPKLFTKFWLWTLTVVWTLRLLKNAPVFSVIQDRLRPSIFRFHSPHSGGMLTDTLNQLSDCGPKDSVSLTAIGVVGDHTVGDTGSAHTTVLLGVVMLTHLFVCLFILYIYINHFVIINSPIKHHTVLINLATQRNICPASNSVPQWTSAELEEPFWGCDSSLGIYTFTIIYTFTHSHLSINHESDEARKPLSISLHGCRVLSVHAVLPVTLTFAHLFGVYLSQYTFGYLGPFWFHRTYRIFYYYESDFYSPVCLNLLLRMRVHTICAHTACSSCQSQAYLCAWELHSISIFLWVWSFLQYT